MKRMLVSIAFGALGFSLTAPALAQRQAPDIAELQKLYQKKVSEAWLKNAGWSLSWEDTLKRAGKEGKPVFAYFTRSYSP